LSREAQKWWRRIVDEYHIGDSGGLAILQIMCEAFDRMRQAQKILAEEGPTITDRFGQLKGHPLLNTERDCRGQVLAALKQLNLDLEPLKEIGRPPGSHYNGD
jgi:P27 family predicted phage terminase small subunit